MAIDSGADAARSAHRLTHELNFAPVAPADQAMGEAARRKVDMLTKPLGSLGRLEALAIKICAIQVSLEPTITAPVAIVFAGDHGVADRGVSAYPRAVTTQMVKNFLSGGAAISVLARLQNFDLWVVDAGVDGDCGADPWFIDAKIRRGTRDSTEQAAMTAEECLEAVRRGRDIVDRVTTTRGNTLLLGEMGIGNTASAALLMQGLTGMALADCVGRGTGLDDAGLDRKRTVLATALRRRPAPLDPLELLAEFGGYEIAMLVGAVLGGAARGCLIIVDGFTVSVAVALAARIDPHVLEYCVFGHRSAEFAHRALLEHLNVQPLIDLEMRLGEGSGSAIALSIVRCAVALFTGMATFESAGVSGKSP